MKKCLHILHDYSFWMKFRNDPQRSRERDCGQEISQQMDVLFSIHCFVSVKILPFVNLTNLVYLRDQVFYLL